MNYLYSIMFKNGKLIKEEKNGELTKDERKLSRYYEGFLGSY